MNSVFPISTTGNSKYLVPKNSYITEIKAKEECELYLTDDIEEVDGKYQKFYRLHAKHQHTPEQALAYDIECPACHNKLKQVGRQLTYNELGLYTCPICNRK